jgi:NTP pyrophosphatase (non-canonical NTP hydrolase)
LLTFKQLQEEVAEWSTKNFPDTKFLPTGDLQPLLGVQEEVGELSRARLKGIQKIRGTASEWRDAEVDAVADILVYLADYCGRRDIDMQQAIESVWAKVVKKRNWVANPESGVTPEESA